MGFPGGSVVKNLPADVGDVRDFGLIPGSERSSAEGNGNPLQYSCLENPMERGAWWANSPWNCKELNTAEHSCNTDTTQNEPQKNYAERKKSNQKEYYCMIPSV